MVESLVFSYKEAIELIMGFYTFTLGYWNDELDQIPEARRFVEMKLTMIDEEYEDLNVLSLEGEQYLHKYIEDISQKFIDYMKHNEFECSHDEAYEWFVKTFSLDSMEDGKDIAEYICMNLFHYGYRVRRCYSHREGKLYRIEKMING